MKFSIERFRDIQPEIDRIGRLHWSETEGYRHGQEYSPDWKRYFSSDDAGWFFVATARDAGKMVGYVGMWAMPSMHTQKLVAMEDFFFLEEPYRKGWNAIKFTKYVEAECIRRGCVEISFTDKKGMGRILEFMGYGIIATQYAKQVVGADSALKPTGNEDPVNVRPFSPTAA